MDEIRMLTYADAAKLLGIKADSVARRARNRRWKRELGNDGFVRVGVPLSAIRLDIPPDIPPDVSPDIPPDIRAFEAEHLARIAALEAEVRLLRENAQDLRQDRDAWRQLSERRWWHGLIPRRS